MRIILVAILSLLFFTSCTSYKQKEIKNDLQSLISDVEKNNLNYTDQDWETKDKDLENILSKDYLPIKNKLTDEQRLEINKLIGKYEALKIKGILKDGFQQLESIIGELSNDTTLLK